VLRLTVHEHDRPIANVTTVLWAVCTIAFVCAGCWKIAELIGQLL